MIFEVWVFNSLHNSGIKSPEEKEAMKKTIRRRVMEVGEEWKSHVWDAEGKPELIMDDVDNLGQSLSRR